MALQRTASILWRREETRGLALPVSSGYEPVAAVGEMVVIAGIANVSTYNGRKLGKRLIQSDSTRHLERRVT